jgi:hypothetical protein
VAYLFFVRCSHAHEGQHHRASFNSFVGIQVTSESGQLLRLPAVEQYLNHLGTVHASAQLALAEASSGEFLLRHFGSSEGLVPIVRRVEAKFRKPAMAA